YAYRVRAEDAGNFSAYSNTASATVPTSGGSGEVAFLQPTNGDKILFIGQDLQSVSEYISGCASCPTPGGTATYVNLAGVLTSNFYGALGFTETKQPFGQDVNWGSGPLNAYSNAVGFSESTVQIGLYLVDQTDQINSGALDDQIGHMGDFFKEHPNTAFYLRIGYEFDGAWNQYNQASYVSAYQRMVDILRANGVTNVAYVWQSSTSPIDDIIDGGQEPLLDYYPGDDYVDWFGMSWFLLPDEQATVGSTVTTQRQLADELVSLARSKGKPVMICESTPQGYDLSAGTNSNISTVWDGGAGGNTVSKSGTQIWNEWFQPFFDYIYANDDGIKGVTFINADWDTQGLWDAPYEQGYWGDGRIQSNSTVESNWVSEITKSGWLHGSASINSALNWSATAARGGKAMAELAGEFDAPAISLYPNPVADRLHISGVDEDFEFVIYDSKGMEMMRGTGLSVDVSQLKSGLYLLHSRKALIRFVKQ
ncbi:MAG TPA: hypothetical protein DCE41_35535, partial [Cytophagales bacterium]|nr:hypothetical protein [Cytophagales bacterium]